MKILVTGGAGFIGSAVIRHILRTTEHQVVNIDKLTYAANPLALEGAESNPRYAFEQVDIVDQGAVQKVFARHRPDRVMHLAAESHVDRSISGSSAFIQTNLIGTYNLLEAARNYRDGSTNSAKDDFCFLHVSTDEVFGSLGDGGLFTETTPYNPNSPYSASKAGSDHLVRAWGETYGLSVLTSNSSNNYGPWQFPEKLIPVVILSALDDRSIPVYGNGENVRDWLHVEDHAEALLTVLFNGKYRETYNIGAGNEEKNINLVKMLCACLDELRPKSGNARYETQVTLVADRPGHDMRYAIDNSKITKELGWVPKYDLNQGLRQTVRWLSTPE